MQTFGPHTGRDVYIRGGLRVSGRDAHVDVQPVP